VCVLRGLAAVGGSFRGPPAGSLRDDVLSRSATRGISADLRCCFDAVIKLLRPNGASTQVTANRRDASRA
jgi:hypothetical protein